MKKNIIIILLLIIIPVSAHATMLINGVDYITDAYYRIVLKYSANGSTLLKTIRKISTPFNASVVGETNAVASAAEVTVADTAGVTVKKTILSTIGRIPGSGMLGIIALGGTLFGLAGDYIDWLIAQGNSPDPLHPIYGKTLSGYIQKTTITQPYQVPASSYPSSCTVSGKYNDDQCFYIGDYTTVALGTTALQNLISGLPTACPNNNNTSWNYGWQLFSWNQTNPTAMPSRIEHICTGNGHSGYWVAAIYFVTANGRITNSNVGPATEADLTSAANTGYGNDVANWQSNVSKTVQAVADAIADENAKIRQAPLLLDYPGLIKKYADTLNPTDQTNQDADVQNPAATDHMTPSDVIDQDQVDKDKAAARAKWTTDTVTNATLGEALSNTQTAEVAMSSVMTDGANIPAPTDIPVVMPTKLSLTNVLTSFVASIRALPMFQTLNGLSINCSGATSNLCLALPSKYGGTVCYDASHMQSTIDMIGSAFLGLSTLMSFLYVFKG